MGMENPPHTSATLESDSKSVDGRRKRSSEDLLAGNEASDCPNHQTKKANVLPILPVATTEIKFVAVKSACTCCRLGLECKPQVRGRGRPPSNRVKVYNPAVVISSASTSASTASSCNVATAPAVAGMHPEIATTPSNATAQQVNKSFFQPHMSPVKSFATPTPQLIDQYKQLSQARAIISAAAAGMGAATSPLVANPAAPLLQQTHMNAHVNSSNQITNELLAAISEQVSRHVAAVAANMNTANQTVTANAATEKANSTPCTNLSLQTKVEPGYTAGDTAFHSRPSDAPAALSDTSPFLAALRVLGDRWRTVSAATNQQALVQGHDFVRLFAQVSTQLPVSTAVQLCLAELANTVKLDLSDLPVGQLASPQVIHAAALALQTIPAMFNFRTQWDTPQSAFWERTIVLGRSSYQSNEYFNRLFMSREEANQVQQNNCGDVLSHIVHPDDLPKIYSELADVYLLQCNGGHVSNHLVRCRILGEYVNCVVNTHMYITLNGNVAQFAVKFVPLLPTPESHGRRPYSMNVPRSESSAAELNQSPFFVPAGLNAAKMLNELQLNKVPMPWSATTSGLPTSPMCTARAASPTLLLGGLQSQLSHQQQSATKTLSTLLSASAPLPYVPSSSAFATTTSSDVNPMNVTKFP